MALPVAGLVSGGAAGNALAEALPRNNDLGDLGTGLVIVASGAVVGFSLGLYGAKTVCRRRLATAAPPGDDAG